MPILKIKSAPTNIRRGKYRDLGIRSNVPLNISIANSKASTNTIPIDP